MARPLRIELDGGLYHITARGNRRSEIFIDDADRHAWLAVLDEVCRRFNWRCHAYCQMSNHYHLVMETPEGNLARGMRQLNGVYTQQVNRRHRLVGHLFQGRYKAILVDQEAYLLELARYVVLNPVRAGMVADAGAWPWSSYSAMIGKSQTPNFLEIDWLLGQFGQDRPTAVRKYIDFVRAGVGLPSIWQNLRDQIFLGGADFIAMVKQQDTLSHDLHGDLQEIPALQRRTFVPLSVYSRRQDRRQAMAEAYLSGHHSMREIADHFGVHYSTVSRAVKDTTCPLKASS